MNPPTRGGIAEGTVLIRRVVNLTLGLTALTAACDTRRMPEATPETRDSAGILIVESRAPSTEWAITPEPEIRIGMREGPPEYQLYRVQFAARLHSGGVVIVDGGSSEVRFFDASGSHVRSLGGRGEGPGEFNRFDAVRVLEPDTLVIWDRGNQRITLVGPSGEAAAQFPVAGVPAFQRPRDFLGLLGDQEAVTLGRPSPEDSVRLGWYAQRGETAVIEASLEGGQADTLAILPGQELLVAAEGSGGLISVMHGPLPFAHDAHVALHTTGVVYALSDRYEITFLDREGRSVRVLRRVDVQPEPIPAQLKERYVVEAVERVRGREGMDLAEVRSSAEARVAAVPDDHTVPVLDGLMVDAEGRLWVRDYEAFPEPEGGRNWVIFEPMGAPLARVRIPERMSVLHIGRDHISVLVRDELDVEFVEVYGIVESR